MTDPTAHWSPSEIDDDGDRASYPPPAFRDGERDPSVIAAYARAEMDRLASDNPDLATAWSDVERAALALVRSSIGASGLLDLDAIEARWRNATKGPWKLTQVRGFGATNIIVSEHPEASWYCVVAIVHNAGGSDAMNAMAAARTDVPALVARVRELEAALAATEAEARTALDALHKRCDAAEAEVGRLRAELDGPAPDADRSRLAPKSPRVVFLYRPKELDRGEHEAAARHFVMAESRLDVRAGDVVIARHFAWPWPRELFDDLRRVGARPVNDARGHAYAADLLAWTDDLGDLCPAATDRFETLPERGPFIVKGEKADKGRWSRMFAETKADAIRLRSELMADSGMRNATIVARQYVVLAPLGDAPVPGACPPSVEFRVFVAFGRVLSAGYYWPPEDCNAALLAASPRPEDIPADFLAEAVARVSPRVDFFTLDVGVDCDGRWWVIEVSDGLRAGMSENDPAAVYAGLAAAIVAHYGDTTRPAAAPDRDLCPTCGALDLDHSPEECARRWAEAHPYAAGATHGGIAHKSEVAK